MKTTPNLAIPYIEGSDYQVDYPAINLDAATIIDTALANLQSTTTTLVTDLSAAETDLDLLDQALTGKANGTGLGLRVDTTVGTRVLLDHPGGTILVSGDTGWRDISSLLLNGWTGTLRIRRENNTIYLAGQSLIPGTSSVVLTGLPAVWRPLLRTPVAAQIEGASPVRGTVQPTGVVNVDHTSAFPRELAGSWSIPHAWPTTHLGTPIA